MADYEEALKKILIIEGKYSNDPIDNGGETYKGIARKFHPHWLGWRIIDNAKKLESFPGGLDKNKTLQNHVKALYKKQYWDAINGDKMPNQHIAEEVLDAGVNIGIRRSARFLQESINLLNRNQASQEDLIIDGVIGNQSINALKKTLKLDKSNQYVLILLNIFQGMRYINILRANPSQEKYTRGWIKRTI